VGTDVDPTGGEWGRTKVMEIWLDTNNPLTEPKWARGNLRDTLDPMSLFHNIITFADPHATTVGPVRFLGDHVDVRTLVLTKGSEGGGINRNWEHSICELNSSVCLTEQRILCSF
jgi:hypothetical protein